MDQRKGLGMHIQRVDVWEILRHHTRRRFIVLLRTRRISYDRRRNIRAPEMSTLRLSSKTNAHVFAYMLISPSMSQKS